MLVLTRKAGETVKIGKNIEVHILKVGGVVRLGIEAPEDVPIRRGELPSIGQQMVASLREMNETIERFNAERTAEGWMEITDQLIAAGHDPESVRLMRELAVPLPLDEACAFAVYEEHRREAEDAV